MRVTRSNKNITSFGGIVPILKIFDDYGLSDMINSFLGCRPKQASYSYDQVIIPLILMSFCGYHRLHNIEQLKCQIENIPNLKIPSHDTLGRLLKQLATTNNVTQNVTRSAIKNKELRQKSNRRTYERITTKVTNENDALNNLLLEIVDRFRVFQSNTTYTVDIDATFIPTKQHEATHSYKKKRGFFPIVSLINDVPVYIGMRNGNVSPMAEIDKTVTSTLELLSKKTKVKINKVRMDSGGFNLNAFRYMEDNGVNFYVGGIRRPRLFRIIQEREEWSPINLETFDHFWNCEVTSFPYTLLEETTPYRMIVLKANKKSEKSSPKAWTYDKKTNAYYKLIITNDWKTSTKEIVEFYNQRGTSENKFDELKNDFGWKYPPFGNLNQNTVYLFIMAISKGLFYAVKKIFHSKGIQIDQKSRMKRFARKYIFIPCEILSNDLIDFFGVDIKFEKIYA